MSIDVPRVTGATPELFANEFMRRGTPVVLTDFFVNQPIRGLVTLDALLASFGGSRVLVRPEYVRAARSHGPNTPIVTSLSNATRLMKANVGLVCTECSIPPAILGHLELPPVCFWRDPSWTDELLDLPRAVQCDISCNMFFATAGNVAHLHYDGDQRHVLLYQACGHKEVILFPPSSGRHLQPTESLVGFAGLSLQPVPAAARDELIHSIGGYRTLLKPGDTLYMPPLAWHYLEYVDDSMSFNVRFGRNRYGRFLNAGRFHRDYYVQTFASAFISEHDVSGDNRSALEHVIATYESKALAKPQKVVAMRQLMRKLCNVVCPDAHVDQYCLPEHEMQEVQKVLSDARLTPCYSDRETLCRLEPTGPARDDQRTSITRALESLATDDSVRLNLIRNVTGQSGLSELTVTEAQRLLTYLKSPVAAC